MWSERGYFQMLNKTSTILVIGVQIVTLQRPKTICVSSKVQIVKSATTLMIQTSAKNQALFCNPLSCCCINDEKKIDLLRINCHSRLGCIHTIQKT